MVSPMLSTRRNVAAVGKAQRRRGGSYELGATAIEYAAIAGLISIAAIVVIGLIGGEVVGFFQSIFDAFP